MNLFSIFFKSKRSGATATGIFSMALGTLLLLCGAGVTPIGNVQKADINANNYSLTNAATVRASNVVATSSLTAPSSFYLTSGAGPLAGVVVCYGDSITCGDGTRPVQDSSLAWPYTLSTLGFAQKMTVYDLGVSGQTLTGANWSSSTAYGGGAYANRVIAPYTGSPHALSPAQNNARLGVLLNLYGFNDYQTIAGIINGVSTTGNTHGTTLIDNLASVSGLVVGGNIISPALDTLTNDNTNPSDGDTVTIGAQVYRFKTNIVQTNDVLIGANADATMQNLVHAVNGQETVGTSYYNGTTPHAAVWTNNAIASHAVIFKSRAQGAMANTIAVASTSAHLTWSTSTFSGSLVNDGATVISINSGGSGATGNYIVASQAAIATASSQPLTFATETMAQFESAEQTANTNARTDGYTIVRIGVLPATWATTLLQTTLASGNTWLATQHYTGSGSGWDYYIDSTAGLPNFAGTQFLVDAIHPSNTGNYVVANFVNSELVRQVSAALTGTINYLSNQGIPDNFLQNDIPFVDVTQTISSPWTFSQATGTTTPLTVQAGNGGYPTLLNLSAPFNQGHQLQFDGGTAGSINATSSAMVLANGPNSFTMDSNGAALFAGKYSAPGFQSTGATASSVAGFDASKNLVSLTLGSGLSLSGGTLSASGGGTGTVTSVAATVPSFLSVAGSPVTTSGTLAITFSGTALPIANGGTGSTTLAGANIAVTNAANTFGDDVQTLGTGTFGSNASLLVKGDTTAKPLLDLRSASAGVGHYIKFDSYGSIDPNASELTVQAGSGFISLLTAGGVTVGSNDFTCGALNPSSITSSGAVTLSGTASLPGGSNATYVKAPSTGTFTGYLIENSSGSGVFDLIYAGSTAGNFYGTGTQGTCLFASLYDINFVDLNAAGKLATISHSDGSYTTASGKGLFGGGVVASVAGAGLQVKEGSNAKQGVATLSGGTTTVSNTSVTTNSRILLTTQTLGTVTVPKEVAITARTAGTSFTITSADNTDTSTVAWEIFEPAP